MDGWLAYHAALIACIAAALFRCGIDPVRLTGDRATLTLMCGAITEAFAALPASGTARLGWVTAVHWPATASMAAYWITIRAVLPWIRVRQAAAVSLGSNAVANTLPGGGALAMGVSWAMLSSWGSTPS